MGWGRGGREVRGAAVGPGLAGEGRGSGPGPARLGLAPLSCLPTWT